MVAQGLFLTTNVLVNLSCAKKCGVEKTCDFQQTTRSSRKWYKTDIWFIWKVKRKSYALFRMVILPMTVSEPNHCKSPVVFYVLGLPYIVLYCLSLNLPPLNPDVTNFQGHSFKTSVTHPLLSFTSPPRDTSDLSRLRKPHGSHDLSHAPKILFNYTLNNYQVPPCNNK